MIRIGTRGSALALWQARNLERMLANLNLESELVIIETKGDKIQHLSFDKIEGKGFFTKEIEEALMKREIDVAVHSLKDLPTLMIDGLVIGGLSIRANPADIMIIHPAAFDESNILKLKPGRSVGTSSIRRKVQLSNFDPKIQLTDIRGNVPTRINKIKEGQVDAVLLAAAGVERLELDLSNFKTLLFNPIEFIPAPGQGVNAYQCRNEDKKMRTILKSIHHSEVAQCTNVERTILKKLEGGCQLPLGAFCRKDLNNNYHCYSMLGSTPGEKLKSVNYSSTTTNGMADFIVSKLLAE